MPSRRSRLITMLADHLGLSQKEVAARAGFREKGLSRLLGRAEIDEEIHRRLLAGLKARPAQAAVLTAALEALDALDPEGELTAGERDEVELGLLEAVRLLRPIFAEAALLSRSAPPLDRYPRPAEVEPARWQARVLFSRLLGFPPEHQLVAVQVARAFQSWALAELCGEESVAAASQDLERAAHLARLGREIAGRIEGPEGWRRTVEGRAAAHQANILRVNGDLEAAREAFEEAKRLGRAGSDPGRVLDPGRLLDLEVSLCRDERRFEEALALLEEAREVSRQPARVLIKKGFTLEVMGEYEQAVAALREAEPLVDPEAEPRLWYMLRFNQAVLACHVGAYREAAGLAEEVRELVTARGDENQLIRVVWLAGRIAAGEGRREEALALLGQARRQFAGKKMRYDAALALLEEAALLLDEGRTAEVQSLAGGLREVFQARGVHREALAALRLFQEAAEREEATAALARRLLAYLFRARHDPGLCFTAA